MGGSYFPVVHENHNFGTSRCRWVGAVHWKLESTFATVRLRTYRHQSARTRLVD